MKAVVATGDRAWRNRQVVQAALRLAYARGARHVIEGGAMGADTCVRQLAPRLGMSCLTMGADWVRFGTAAGPKRNLRMLQQPGVLEVLAFHDWLLESKGTRNCVQQALELGLPVQLWTTTQGLWGYVLGV